MHEGGGRWVGSNKLVELKKKKKKILGTELAGGKGHTTPKNTYFYFSLVMKFML